MNRRETRAGTLVAMMFGLSLMVIGTFLPWMTSGSVTRNSYQAGGVARRVLQVPTWLSGALHVWPFVGLACAVVVALIVAGLPQPAGVFGVVVSVACAAVSIGTLTLDGNAAVRPNSAGPATTIIGAVMVLASSTLLLRGSERPPRSAL
jgi:hypothetical protein